MSEIRRKPDIAWRIYEDQGVLLDVDNEKVLGLNSTAARIWELLESETTADELTERLADEFAVSVETARADVDEFLAALESRGLVVVTD